MKTCAADEAQALIQEIAELLVADFSYSRLTKRKGGNSGKADRGGTTAWAVISTTSPTVQLCWIP